jgi:hypothetical protein
MGFVSVGPWNGLDFGVVEFGVVEFGVVRVK